jgi:redox-sensitive bicupin YhaK (pirin superfamily)
MARLLIGKQSDIGGLTVKRFLPRREQRMVGPFIFFDEMGPAEFHSGEGINVKPHPHIGLATITYLFEGSILHRDSLGNTQEILPGDVNWMTAGIGITHSERETESVRNSNHQLHGIQTWVALPPDHEETPPEFQHVKKADLPHFNTDQLITRLIAGEVEGKKSPVNTFTPMFYLDIIARTSATVERPLPDQEAAFFVIDGSVKVGTESFGPGQFVILDDESEMFCNALSRIILFGGNRFEIAPFINWNFVSFSRDRIQQARDRWKLQNFPRVVDDEEEYVPLPD